MRSLANPWVALALLGGASFLSAYFWAPSLHRHLNPPERRPAANAPPGAGNVWHPDQERNDTDPVKRAIAPLNAPDGLQHLDRNTRPGWMSKVGTS